MTCAVFAFTILAPMPVGPLRGLLRGIEWVIGCAAAAVTLASAVVLWRARVSACGGEDLFLRLNRSRSETGLRPRRAGSVSRWITRAWSARIGGLRVGDEVEVRSLAEIQRTLDAAGTFEGLPFQPEMAAYCGGRFRVYRCIDKIYDYGRTSRMRRLKSAVTLIGLRCDGSAHGGCQARCYLIWKQAWLKPVSNAGGTGFHAPAAGTPAGDSVPAVGGSVDRPSAGPTPSVTPEQSFRCQLTQLAAASTPLHDWDIRQDLRPVMLGNVTLAAFTVAMLTRFFNRVQALRRGVPFPMLSRCDRAVTITPLPVAPGQHVRVCTASEIATTLDARSRNRGLWFDLDMLRHCGRPYEARARVERLIDAVSGRMVLMKTPCLILEGVVASGEFLRFCPQHEPIFWREVWLRPETAVMPRETLSTPRPLR